MTMSRQISDAIDQLREQRQAQAVEAVALEAVAEGMRRLQRELALLAMDVGDLRASLRHEIDNPGITIYHAGELEGDPKPQLVLGA